MSKKVKVIAIGLGNERADESADSIEQYLNDGYEHKHIQFLSHAGDVVFCAYLEKDETPPHVAIREYIEKHPDEPPPPPSEWEKIFQKWVIEQFRPPEPRQNPSHSDAPRPTQPPGETSRDIL